MILVFDTETTGLPLWNEPSDDPRQPHVVDIACSLFDETGVERASLDAIINPGIEIPAEVAAIHGITTEIAQAEGVPPEWAFGVFAGMVQQASLIVGHNVSFDIRMMRILGARVTGEKWECDLPQFCTMKRTTGICKILKQSPRTHNDWKWPTLAEATRHFFGIEHEGAHRARPDCDASARIYFHLAEQGIAA
jgi:DNA polymerase III epsilon subunit-like protein